MELVECSAVMCGMFLELMCDFLTLKCSLEWFAISWSWNAPQNVVKISWSLCFPWNGWWNDKWICWSWSAVWLSVANLNFTPAATQELSKLKRKVYSFLFPGLWVFVACSTKFTQKSWVHSSHDTCWSMCFYLSRQHLLNSLCLKTNIKWSLKTWPHAYDRIHM